MESLVVAAANKERVERMKKIMINGKEELMELLEQMGKKPKKYT